MNTMTSCLKVLSAAWLALFGIAAVYAQQADEKLVSAKDDIEQINDAVLISNIAVAGRPLECGLFIKPPVLIQPVTPFKADSDWLQQMTVSLVNRTNRTIAAAVIILHFLDTGDCRFAACAGVGLLFGQRPAIDAYDGRTGQPLKPDHPERPPLDWKPEQTIVLHISDFMPEIEENLELFGMPVTGVSKVKLYRGVFYFSDGMSWSLGTYSVPDPDHPGKFNHLPGDYFPGSRGNNWPPGYTQ